MEDMSCFKDKEFDYVRSHHVIEHTNDPDKACSELVRIGKRGIISFPTAQAEIQFGRRDHNWFVFVDRGRLLFIRKRNPSYGVPRHVTGCGLNVNFEWEGSFKWQVVE
jgi:ubiquinone/menaquinone biosynthesis C-methylase UbiE